MLTSEDLNQIGNVVDKKLDEKLETVLEAVREGFDAVDRRFEDIEAKMATKAELSALKHELMDHTDRTTQNLRGELKGDMRELRSELRERDLIA